MIGGGAILSDFIEKQIGYQIKAISEGLNDSARQCLNMLEKIENCQQSYKEVLKVFYCAQRITIPGQPVSDSNTEILEADLLFHPSGSGFFESVQRFFPVPEVPDQSVITLIG